jgi:uncharacterized peroxidase-related enzyme
MTARIQPTTIETAPDAARPMLQAIKQGMGMTPNLFATIAHSPEALAMLLSGMEGLGKGKLSAREVEVVNIYASELNGCGYCVSAHAGLGKRAGLTQPDIDAVRLGRGASPREDALIAFTRRVVRTGGAGVGTELVALREAGLSDGEVIEAIAHIALKAFTNAVALVANTDIDFPRQPHLPSL